jgi:hypothetical protein
LAFDAAGGHPLRMTAASGAKAVLSFWFEKTRAAAARA